MSPGRDPRWSPAMNWSPEFYPQLRIDPPQNLKSNALEFFLSATFISIDQLRYIPISIGGDQLRYISIKIKVTRYAQYDQVYFYVPDNNDPSGESPIYQSLILNGRYNHPRSGRPEEILQAIGNAI